MRGTPWILGLLLTMGALGLEPSSGFCSDDETTTPINHLVVIFQENVSFDHYFATYPVAASRPGEPAFVPDQQALSDTPSVNGLSGGLLTNNPNSAPPFRLDRSQNHTCDMNHDYTPEQQAADGGLMDKFVEFTGTACTDADGPNEGSLGKGIVMGYYDGNTVTGLWNYAQHFAVSDNSYGTTFGPSTPGALNLISGQTNGIDQSINTGGDVVGGSVIGDPDPFYDDCSGSEKVGMAKTNKNIGDLLNATGVTWGWFEGGFKPSSVVGGVAVCNSKTNRLDGTPVKAYSPHHEPFQYYASTANQHHTAPANLGEIGHNGPANHQYDLADFLKAARSGNLPAVSFLKANRAQDGHAGYSTPLDEQVFLVNTINALQRLPQWESTAVIIAYDDSDGWYDHVMGPIVNQSSTTADALTGPGSCGTGTPLEGFEARCGYGPRLPLLVISPFAKANFVDHTTTDQSSILRFIEDNWLKGQRIGGGSFDALAGSLTNMFDFRTDEHAKAKRLFLDPLTGQPMQPE